MKQSELLATVCHGIALKFEDMAALTPDEKFRDLLITFAQGQNKLADGIMDLARRGDVEMPEAFVQSVLKAVGE